MKEDLSYRKNGGEALRFTLRTRLVRFVIILYFQSFLAENALKKFCNVFCEGSILRLLDFINRTVWLGL
jgi:hypothetical protein|tara:strand:+ start:2953 stop:3159 length:207 start_codon:yes stop_codon:yes gene_type:complete